VRAIAIEGRSAFIAEKRIGLIAALAVTANYARLIRHACVSSAIQVAAQRVFGS
jgi:hypothetical protein